MPKEATMSHLAIDLVNTHMAERHREAAHHRLRHIGSAAAGTSTPAPGPVVGWVGILYAFRATATAGAGPEARA
jgi:hypothetical protein